MHSNLIQNIVSKVSYNRHEEWVLHIYMHKVRAPDAFNPLVHSLELKRLIHLSTNQNNNNNNIKLFYDIEVNNTVRSMKLRR